MRRPLSQFNLTATLLGLHVIITAPASAQRCRTGIATDRVLAIVGTYAVLQTSAIAIRHSDWWDTPTRSFHFDWGRSPSKGQDVLLHAAVSYHTSQLGAIAWRWACVDRIPAAWLGAALGIAVGLPKEIGDGFHERKGFSGTDFLWGTVGAALPAARETWAPMRMFLLKGNYWPSDEYRNRTPGALPQLENDYAGQRYFLAVNPGLLPGGAGPWPDWLGLALGHSVPHWISQPPIREWYLTLDMNLRGLPIRSGWWRTVATLLDQVHFPAPGVRLRNGEVVIGLF